MRVFPIVVALAVLCWIPTAAMAGYQVVSGAMNRNTVVGYNEWDAYEIQISSSARVDIHLSADNWVDFYVFTASEYSDYVNPSVYSFGYEARQENARTFDYSVSQAGLIVVIDNADISASGASPSGSVSYSVSVSFPGGLDSAATIGIVVAAIAILAVVVVVVAVLARRTAMRRRLPVAGMPAPGPIPYPPGPMSGAGAPAYAPPYPGGSPQAPYVGAGSPALSPAPLPPVDTASAVPPPPYAPAPLPTRAAFCPACGTPAVSGAAFCVRCGNRLG